MFYPACGSIFHLKSPLIARNGFELSGNELTSGTGQELLVSDILKEDLMWHWPILYV